MLIEEALAYLDGANGKNIELGLNRIQQLIDRLERPDDRLKIIHITGTNGKGSTCEIMSNLLQAAGYKVGTFNSPYFDSPCECIRINGSKISEDKLLEEMNEIEELLVPLKREDKCPSGFEILVAIALKHFAKEKVDFVLLEVGLGGRLDATNVIKHPIACVFTKISLDHTNLLGNTIEEIAREKAGIIKEDSFVITGPQEEQVMAILEQKSRELSVKLIKIEAEEVRDICVDSKDTSFCFKDKCYHLPLIGWHQAYNGSLALQVVASLHVASYLQIDDLQIQSGFQSVKWPGRFELINKTPEIYLDGAHNLDGIKSLSKTLKAIENAYTIGVVGVLRDKDYEKMLEAISEQINELIVTKPDHIRALDERVLAREASSYFEKVTEEEEAEKALELAIKKANEMKGKVRIVCFGSLYMIAALRRKILAQ